MSRNAPFPYAGFFRRSIAFFIDVIPIVIITFSFAYFFAGFDEPLSKRLEGTQTNSEKIRFAIDRKILQALNTVLWIIYSTVAEASSFQGTLGKRLLGMKVFRDDGRPLTWSDAFRRNMGKLVSAVPLGLGFLWAIFHKEKKTWHDKLAHTSVIKTSYLQYAETAQ